jgi:peptide/nickel transport system permease protein
MGAYLFRRLIMTVLVIVLVMTFLGALVHIIPGDPVTLMLGPRATPELIAQVRSQMELDKPVYAQVGNFMVNAAQGDLGVDFVTDTSVMNLVMQALPPTLALAALSLILAAVFGIPLGILSATRPNSLLDRVTAVFSVSMITIPPYVAGLLLLVIFAVRLKALPSIGSGDISDPVDYFLHLILPVTALAITWIGYIARLVRSSMLEVLNADYIRTARAYGLSDRRVAYKYALRNAIIPTIAVLGVAFGSLIGVAIFVEVIFARAGLGMLVFDAIQARNYPLVRGGVLAIAILFVLANLVADLTYQIVDPRIRARSGGGR